MNLAPLGTQILVKFLRPEEPAAGALLIPDYGPPKAVVLAQGSGTNRMGVHIGFDTKVGDIVYVGQHINGTEIKQDGEVYGVMDEDSLLGLVGE